MTYGTIKASVPVLQKLVNQQLPLAQAYRLMKIVRRVNEELVFFNERLDKIKKSDREEQDKIKMADDLLNLEIDWEFGPLVLDSDIDIQLSAADLDAAEGMITIKEGGTNDG